jgi:ribonuclease BN (tRNA processing enzyme)
LIHDTFFARLPAVPNENHSLVDDVAMLAEQVGARVLALVHRAEPDQQNVAEYYKSARRFFAGAILIPLPGDTTTI